MSSSVTENLGYRLPLDVKPTHYDLTVRTDLEKLTFKGVVEIQYVINSLHLVSNIIRYMI